MLLQTHRSLAALCLVAFAFGSLTIDATAQPKMGAASRFVVVLDGKQIAEFKEFTLNVATPAPLHEGGKTTPTPFRQSVPGSFKWSPVTLRRGRISSGNSAFLDWLLLAQKNSPAARRSVTIIEYDGPTIVARYQLHRAWPLKLVPPNLHSPPPAAKPGAVKNNDIAIESLEIAHEGIDVTR
jgi:phage tail-like protein